MPVTTISVERFSLIAPRPFADVLAAIEAAIGHPDVRQMSRNLGAAASVAEMEAVAEPLTGPTGLMEFFRLNLGDVIGKESPTPRRCVRLLVGNPIIMRSMASHVPDAGSYAPVTVLIDERTDGVHLSYDRMASQLAPYGSGAAGEVARDLDRKVEALLTSAAGQ